MYHDCWHDRFVELHYEQLSLPKRLKVKESGVKHRNDIAHKIAGTPLFRNVPQGKEERPLMMKINLNASLEFGGCNTQLR